jgi:hypothetical protein
VFTLLKPPFNFKFQNIKKKKWDQKNENNEETKRMQKIMIDKKHLYYTK